MSWTQTIGNRKMDLSAPSMTAAQLIDEVPEALGRAVRFAGNTRSGPYSIAQHCVLGADHLLYNSVYGGKLAAAAFLLHDAHEYVIGDKTTPSVADTAQRILRLAGPEAMNAYLQAEAEQKADLDAVIYRAAGLDWPLNPTLAAEIKDTDIRMLATERRWLLGPSPAPWHPAVETAKPIRFQEKITIWPWDRAADEYRRRLRRWLPAIAAAWLDHAV